MRALVFDAGAGLMLLPALNGVARFPIKAFPSLLRECSEIPQNLVPKSFNFCRLQRLYTLLRAGSCVLTFFLQARDFMEIVYGIRLAKHSTLSFRQRITSHTLRVSPYSPGMAPLLDYAYPLELEFLPTYPIVRSTTFFLVLIRPPSSFSLFPNPSCGTGFLPIE